MKKISLILMILLVLVIGIGCDRNEEKTANQVDIDGIKTVDVENEEVEENEEERETAHSNIPKFVKKDFDVVAVADYYGEIDKVGFIDKEGDFVIEPQFDKADIFSSGVAAAKIDDKWGVIDKTGKFTIQPSLENPIRFVEGLAVMKSEDTGKVGYTDITGKFVVEPVYMFAERFFSEGYAFVSKDSDFKTQGYVDKMGTFVEIPISGRALGVFLSENPAPVYKEYGRGGYIDNTWEFVIEPSFSVVDNFSEGLALVYTEDDGWGFIDKTSKYIIGPVKYADFGKFGKVDGIFDHKKAEIAELEIK